jgi:hypothetical protein
MIDNVMTRLNIAGQTASQLRFAQFSLSHCSSWFVFTFAITFNKVIRRYGNVLPVLPVLRTGLGIFRDLDIRHERGTSGIVSKVTQPELILSAASSYLEEARNANPKRNV